MGRTNLGRVTVAVDRDLLREAQRALGTRGPAETVSAALAEAVRERRAPASPVPGLPALSPQWTAALRRARPARPGD